ncbi:MAG: thioredoxin-dependent thiol peroxidase [Parvibaculum sp.]|nr:thioredoxin-dependent thiol peroxidase [Parvibaculum sp.]
MSKAPAKKSSTAKPKTAAKAKPAAKPKQAAKAKAPAKPKAAKPAQAAAASGLPGEGQRAPAFSLPADDGTTVSLKSLAGKKAVLYFYPKDDTPGCTTEGIAFSALKKKFEAAGTVVLGISKDSIEAHCKFRDKHNLTVRLLSDEDGKMLEAYGVWKEKSLYGRKFMGIERSTFLIDEKGVVRRVWPKVKVNGHADEVLEAAKAL